MSTYVSVRPIAEGAFLEIATENHYAIAELRLDEIKTVYRLLGSAIQKIEAGTSVSPDYRSFLRTLPTQNAQS